MRNYILTDRDRNIIESYLREGKREDGIDHLRFMIRKHIPRLKKDLKLIEKFISTSARSDISFIENQEEDARLFLERMEKDEEADRLWIDSMFPKKVPENNKVDKKRGN